MAVKTAQYASPTSQDTGRGPSMSIWKDCPIEDLMQDAGGGFKPGYFFQDDFLGAPAMASFAPGEQLYSAAATVAQTGQGIFGQWSIFVNNSAGAIGPSADTTNLPLEGGVLGLVSGASGSVVALQANGSGFGFVDASSTTGNFRGKMWFEASVALSSLVSTGNALFIGLAGLDGGGANAPTGGNGKLISSTTASGLVNTNSFFGFYKPSASPLVNAANPSKTITGSLFNDFIAGVYNVAGGTIQFPGSASNLWTILTNTGFSGSTLAAATFTTGNFTKVSTMKVKLGWVYDPTPAVLNKIATAAVTANQTVGTTYKAIIRFFVNGQESGAFLVPADIQASTFPSVWMCPMIAFQAGAGTAGIAYVDWIRCAQLGTY